MPTKRERAIACAHKAKAILDSDAGGGHAVIRHAGNKLLYLYLQELKFDKQQDEGDQHWLFTLAKAIKSVKECTYRVADARVLQGLGGFGGAMVKLVTEHLWQLHPPDSEDEDEAAERKQKQTTHKQQQQNNKASGSGAGRPGGSSSQPRPGSQPSGSQPGGSQQQRGSQQPNSQPTSQPVNASQPRGSQPGGARAAGAGVGVGGVRGPSVASHNVEDVLRYTLAHDALAPGIFERISQTLNGTNPAAAAAGSRPGPSQPATATAAAAAAAANPAPNKGRKRPAATDCDDDCVDDAAPAKKQKKANVKKDYIPGRGTANYAFVIILYMAHKQGKAPISKEDLIAAAEASGLSDTPIRGNGNAWAANAHDKWYDGWSSMKTLKKQDPPLVETYSNPIKVRLNAEGKLLGAKMYKDALTIGQLKNPLAGVDVDADIAAYAAAVADTAGTAAHASAAGCAPAAAGGNPAPGVAAGMGMNPSTVAGNQRGSGGATAAPARPDYAATAEPDPSGPRPDAPAEVAVVCGSLTGIFDCKKNKVKLPDGVVVTAAEFERRAGKGSQKTWRVSIRLSNADASTGPTIGDWLTEMGYGGPKARKVKATASTAPPGATAATATAAGGAAAGAGLHADAGLGDTGDRFNAHGGNSGGSRAYQVSDCANDAEAQTNEGGIGVNGDDDFVDFSMDDDGVNAWGAGNFGGRGGSAAGDEGFHDILDDDPWMHDSELPPSHQGAPTGVGQSQHASQSQTFDHPVDSCDIHMSDEESYYDDIVPAHHPKVWDKVRQAVATAKAAQAAAAAASESAAAATAASAIHVGRHQQQQRQQQQQHMQQPTTRHSNSQAQNSSKHNKQQQQGSQQPSQPTQPTQQPPLHSQQQQQQTEGNTATAGVRQPPGPSATASQTTAGGGTASQPTPWLFGLDATATRPWNIPLLGECGYLDSVKLRVPPLPPGVAFRDLYDVVLLVDNREQWKHTISGRKHSTTDAQVHHRNTLRTYDINVDVAGLNCGDYLWVAQHKTDGSRYVLDFIAERKSYADLVGSIQSGRYDNQKYRIEQCGLRHRCYIFEGRVDSLAACQDSQKLACRTALAKTAAVAGYIILEPDGAPTTLKLLAKMTKTLSEVYGPKTSASAPSGAEPLELYATWNNRAAQEAKRKNVGMLWQEMLTAVPGIGTDAALAISQKYTTPMSLYKAYKAAWCQAVAANQSAVAAAQGLLATLPMPYCPRLTLGSGRSKKVFDCLFANGFECQG